MTQASVAKTNVRGVGGAHQLEMYTYNSSIYHTHELRARKTNKPAVGGMRCCGAAERCVGGIM